MRKPGLFASLTLALLTGCPDREIATVDPKLESTEAKTILGNQHKIDLLFVIDNSNSMREEQDSLVANFSKFIAVLQRLPGGLPDMHIGVVTSDLGLSGSSASVLRCGANGQAGAMQTGGLVLSGGVPYIVDAPTGTNGAQRVTNYAGDPVAGGDLAKAFEKMAKVGDQGCGFEQHLGAIDKALNSPANNGFLRSDALLAIVVIADEDDCSAEATLFGGSPELGGLDNFRCTDQGIECAGATNLRRSGAYAECKPKASSPHMRNVQDLIAAIKKKKTFASEQILVAGIIGDPENVIVKTTSSGSFGLEPSCVYNKPNCVRTPTETCEQVAAPGIRLKAFFDGFPLSFETSICQSDLAQPIENIAQKITRTLQATCFEAPLATPLFCNVTDIANYQTDMQTEQILPQCDASKSNKPCWSIVQNSRNCDRSLFAGQEIVFERTNSLPPTTVTRVECESVAK